MNPDNAVWAIDNNGQLCSIDINKKNTVLINGFSGEAAPTADNKLFEIESDSKGNIWLAGKKEVYHYNVANRKLSTYIIPIQQFLKYSKSGIKSLVLVTDSKNNAWAATNAGLFKFDVTTKKVNYFYDSINTKLACI